VTHSVLITGGAGFIGKRVHAVLERQGWSIVSLDSKAARLDRRCLLCDITDARQLESIFRAHRFERIIHAASILPTAAKLDPHKATEVNIGGSLNILERAARFKVNRVIYASSGSVYGTQPASKLSSFRRISLPRPKTFTEPPSGMSKFWVRHMCESLELSLLPCVWSWSSEQGDFGHISLAESDFRQPRFGVITGSVHPIPPG